MAKKKRKSNKKTKSDSAGAEFRDSAKRIWLAGLGAVAATEEEGGKLFRSLVSRGADYESKVASEVKKAGSGLKSRAGKARKQADSTASKVRRRAESAWGDLEEAFDSQVDSALHRIGVPSQRRIDALTRKVEQLIKTLENKQVVKKITKKKVTKKKASKKPAAKKVTKKKPARKATKKKTTRKKATK